MSIPYMHYAPSNAKKMASLNAQLKKNWLLYSVDNLICFLFFSLKLSLHLYRLSTNKYTTLGVGRLFIIHT